MPNLNRVMLMGNLTRDPELRYLPSNVAVVNIGVAVNRKWRNQHGETQEEVTFVDCSAFGKTAEAINQYLTKGRPIYIDGRLKLDQWQDRSGNNRSKLNVIIESFQFLDYANDRGSGQRGGQAGQGSYAAPQSPPPAQQQAPPPQQPPPNHQTHMAQQYEKPDDDIPF